AAAADVARGMGLESHVLSDAIEGEAREAGLEHARLALAAKGPCVLLSGGETTVTIQAAHGRGGRNSEFMLAFALGIAGAEGIHALAADTDGIDGSEDNAGAFADGGSVARMKAQGLDAVELLQAHDAWQAFAGVGDLFITGPTRTNVNDFRAMLITPSI
ncbi:MAG: glycerate kinase, partial [Aestuariivirgaceae bacterium]|nr:glycerate kinase [Aestuariivirgaceae bacterium]